MNGAPDGGVEDNAAGSTLDAATHLPLSEEEMVIGDRAVVGLAYR
jgi:hypothetical protein